MASADNLTRSPLRLIFTFIVVIIVPLAVGIYAAPRAVPQPKVGVIRLYYEIFDLTAEEFKAQLAYARNDPSIKAVVIIINSPGGTANDSEEMYLDVLKTRQEMPIVASVDFLAASGAYYVAAAADEIYAKPGSAIGSIGVITFLPDTVFIEEDLLTTGPYKAFGGTRDGFSRRAETLKDVFVNAVAVGRGDRLLADFETLTRAEIFDGVTAQQLGMIDGMISTQEAIARAGALAGLRDYEVVELYPLTFMDDENPNALAYRPPQIDLERLWAMPADLPPGIYYRYIELPNR
ncbi:MAG: S49 family peptidase [Chloroflexi bacterium]|nr:S49 family peptidase [Ardenticatenaceae bacterium]MBL1129128.1 S49 family peptidase [Chloroflexota bacterium]NOG35206.1 S49 family peptidase [Chloroflexota bacterium]